MNAEASVIDSMSGCKSSACAISTLGHSILLGECLGSVGGLQSTGPSTGHGHRASVGCSVPFFCSLDEIEESSLASTFSRRGRSRSVCRSSPRVDLVI